jgi:hypothetical protein
VKRVLAITSRSLTEQITNSLWTFLALRLVFSTGSSIEISQVGIVSLMSYTWSGLLRSKFIHPIYASVKDHISLENHHFIFFRNNHLAKWLVLSVLTTGGFIVVIKPDTYRFGLELLVLSASIVGLDFLRSTRQINFEFTTLIIVNLFAATILALVQFQFALSQDLFLSNINIWIATNFVGCVVIVLKRRVSKMKPCTQSQSEEENADLDLGAIGTTNLTEFVLARILGVIGLTWLFKLSPDVSSNYVIALYVYSTIPFSVLNGLAPIYFRYRAVAKNRNYLFIYVITVFLVSLVTPIISRIFPEIVKMFFGKNWESGRYLVFFILVIVLHKAYDSARSLDYLMCTSRVKYILVKGVLNIFLSTLPFFAIASGETVIASCIVLTLLSIQVLVFEKTLK